MCCGEEKNQLAKVFQDYTPSETLFGSSNFQSLERAVLILWWLMLRGWRGGGGVLTLPKARKSVSTERTTDDCGDKMTLPGATEKYGFDATVTNI
jgi:hypothetical protein